MTRAQLLAEARRLLRNARIDRAEIDAFNREFDDAERAKQEIESHYRRRKAARRMELAEIG